MQFDDLSLHLACQARVAVSAPKPAEVIGLLNCPVDSYMIQVGDDASTIEIGLVREETARIRAEIAGLAAAAATRVRVSQHRLTSVCAGPKIEIRIDVGFAGLELDETLAS